MSGRIVRRSTAVLTLALGLWLVPLPAAEAAMLFETPRVAERFAELREEGRGLFAFLWTLLTGAWEEEGASTDPWG